MTATEAHAEQILGLVVIGAIVGAALLVGFVDERRIRRARRRKRRIEGHRPGILVLDDAAADWLRRGYTIRRRAFDWALDDPELLEGPTTRDRLRANALRN